MSTYGKIISLGTFFFLFLFVCFLGNTEILFNLNLKKIESLWSFSLHWIFPLLVKKKKNYLHEVETAGQISKILSSLLEKHVVNNFPAPFNIKHALVTPGEQVWKWCFPSVDLVLKIAISILDLLFPLLPVLYPPKLVLLQLCRWWQFPAWCCNTVEGNFFF